MSASVTLIIPNKADHITYRDELKNKHGLYVNSISELTTTRDLLTHRQQTVDALTLDNAATILEKYQRDVGDYNIRCLSTQNRININNDALQGLLERIKRKITQAQATKAAADAAAATKAEENEALDLAKQSLQTYIASLETQLQGINDDKLDDIAGQIQSSVDTIRALGAGYSVSLLSGDAIGQDTKGLITEFNADTAKEVDSTTSSLNALKGDFGKAKNTIADALNAKIQALQTVALGANVTAKQITDALKADKQNRIDDTSLGEIKGRATELATDIGKKATSDFPTRKREIDGLIEADKASFEEKQKITEEFKKITDIFDSGDFKGKEQAIKGNIESAKIAENAAVNESGNIRDKMLKNIQFGTAITELGTSISSLETKLAPIQNLEEKLKGLQARSAKIKPPPIDVAPFQARLDILKAAKAEYDRLHRVQQTRANVLSAENAVARSRSPSPVSSPSTRTDAAQRRGRSVSSSDSENEEADKQSSSLMDRRKRPGSYGRVPPKFQGAPPPPKRTRYLYIPPTNTEENIYIIDLDKEPDSDSGGGGAAVTAAKTGGGKIIQRGGNPPPTIPTGAVMYRLNKTYEDKILLLASLRSAEDVLNDEELIQKLKERATKVSYSDTTAIAQYNAIQTQLISNTDTGILTIARRAVYKSSILDLMGILDEKIIRDSTQPNQQIPHAPDVAPPVEVLSTTTRSRRLKLPQPNPPQEAPQEAPKLLTYTYMYDQLWSFMHSAESVGIIKQLKPRGTLEIAFATIDFSQIVGWKQGHVTNPNLDKYFDAFITCRTGKSTFLTEITNTADKNVAYRFKLNWIILIAFYCLQNFPDVTYENVGELIKNTYDTFLGWMKQDKDTYAGMFLHSRSSPTLEKSMRTYSQRVTDNISRNINTDTTLGPLKTKIIKKLCEGQMTTDATNHKNDPEPPSEDFSTVGPIVPPLSSSKVDSGIAGATTSSASQRQAWMTADTTSPRTVHVPVGPRTPITPASQQLLRRPPLSTTDKAFERVPSPPKGTVPSLNLQSIPRVPVEIQSAKTSEQLLSELSPNRKHLIDRLGNQSARSSRYNMVDPNNPALRPGANGSYLPGRFGYSADSRNKQVSEGTGGNLDFLSQTPKSSEYQVLLPNPVPPTSRRTDSQPPVTRRNRLPGQFKNSNSGGGKRTRKHRSVPSSVPVPAHATRRHHRDNSTANASSSQKRTRRRRPQRRDH